MKRYYYIAVIAAAALLIGGIGAGVFLLSKRHEPVSPVPGAVLESETVTQEHEADSSGRESEKDQTGAGKAYGDQSGGGMAAGLPGSLVKAQQAEGRISEDSLSQAGTPGMERETGEEYCLVSENGFLLVFAKDRSSVFLDTHMPLAEFPLAEQERLLDGIWFSSMIEVLNYLESFTS